MSCLHFLLVDLQQRVLISRTVHLLYCTLLTFLLMLLAMLRAMKRKMRTNTRMLILPFAELSVTVFLYFWIIESVILDLMTQKARKEITKQNRGIASSTPVPALLLIEIFPCEI